MADIKKEEIGIIYEDKDLLVLDKPAGWVVTDEGRNTGGETVEDWLKTVKGINVTRSGIVHRLDKGTSGILVVGKTEEAWKNLQKQFKQRRVAKYYLALAGGDLPRAGEMRVPIERSKYVFGKFGVGVDGKTAATEFKRIKKITIEGKIYSLVEIHLLTGRTHQIRVHMSYMGWPLLGDKLYGGKMEGGVVRPFLHAAKLMIYHPTTGKELHFESHLPDELVSILNQG